MTLKAKVGSQKLQNNVLSLDMKNHLINEYSFQKLQGNKFDALEWEHTVCNFRFNHNFWIIQFNRKL